MSHIWLRLREWFWALSVRSKLLLLVLLVLAPLVLLQTIWTFARIEKRMQRELQANVEFADVIATAYTNYLQDLWGRAHAAGAAIAHARMSQPQAREYLIQQLDAIPTAVRLSLIHTQGRVAVGSHPLGDQLDVSDRDYFRAILSGKETAISDLLSTKLTQEPMIILARAIRVENRLEGVMIAGVPPNLLGKPLSVQRVGNRTFKLVDRQGNLVYQSDSIQTPVGVRLDGLDFVRSALSGTRSTTREFRVPGESAPALGAAVPISGIGWAVVASTPVSVIWAEIRGMVLLEVGLLLGIALLSLGCAYLLAREMIRPITVLRMTAESISGGDLRIRTNVKGTDELAVTAQTFDHMLDRLQELESNRMSFLQVAAHELRNPMAGVKGTLSLVRRRIAMGKQLGEQTELLGIMERDISRMSSLLTEILESYLVQAGQLAIRLQRIDFSQVVSSAVGMFPRGEGAHDIEVRGPDAGPCWVMGDYVRLEEVFRNLIDNAIKYSPNGGRIRIATSKHAGTVVISVSDSGIGIAAEHLSMIFDRFVRVDSLQGRDPGGLGLGLFICRDIVQRHGGRIWVDSVLGQGSTFHVELPLATQP